MDSEMTLCAGMFWVLRATAEDLTTFIRWQFTGHRAMQRRDRECPVAPLTASCLDFSE